MAEELNDGFCDEADRPTDAASHIIYDTKAKGFGLRVTKAGAKSFILNYRNRAGRERRLTIGTFRDPWKTKPARKEAMRLKGLIDQGEDPQGDKNAIRSAPTVNDLIKRWREEHAPKKRERSRAEDEKLIKQWIEPELGTTKVAELLYEHITGFHRKITTKRGTPYRANRALALLSTLLTLAVRWKMRTDNPAIGVERNQEERRYRYLDAEELGRLTKALAEHPNQVVANAIRLLMLTGARKGEVLGASWSQFDLTTGVWTKPSSHTKQKKEHRVPLSAPARQLLAEMRRATNSPVLFPLLRDLRDEWLSLCRAAKLEGVRVHDLRHTYASVLASAGLSLPVIGALLGHTAPATTARYTHLFDDPLRAATEQASVIIMKTG